MANTYTLQDLYNIWYGIIAQAEDSTAYPVDLFKSFLNKAQNDICYGNVQNLQTNERLKKQALNFLESSQFYSTKLFSAITTAPAVWDTVLNCTNTLASSGLVWVNGDIISYTWNTWTQLTWIPTTGDLSIQFPNTAWTLIFQLETLPTDYGQLSKAFLTLNNFKTRETLIWIDSRDLSSPIPNSNLYRFFFDKNYSSTAWLNREYYYSIIKGKYILFMTPNIASQSISFEYQKRPTQLVNITDTLAIPDDYSLNTIPYMAMAEMMMNRWEADEWMKLNNFWFQNIKSMYEFYASQRVELMYNQRVRSVSDWFWNF